MNYSMNEEELRNFCIEHNLPFAIEFKEPWYPKPIEIPQSVINDNKAIFDSIVYGNVTFHIIDD